MERGGDHRTGFVKLVDSERPAWREALLLGFSNGWLQLLIRARGRSDIPEGMTQTEISGKVFYLLGCPPNKFMAFCEGKECLRLDTDLQELQSKGQECLASENEMVFLSAGESTKEESQKKKRSTRRSRPSFKKESSSEEEDSEKSSSENSDLGDALAQLKKKWQEKGTPGARRSGAEKRSGRHSLLQLKDKETVSHHQGRDLMLKTVATEQDPLRAWVTLQVYKDLQRGQRHRRSHQDSWSDDNESSGSASSSGKEKYKKPGGARAVENFEAAKRKMKKNPLRYVRRFVKDLERELGAEGRPFRIHEGSKRIPWGKQKTLQRCYHMFAEVLELMLREKWERAALQVVLCLKSVHQTALDNGDWSVSWMLTHLSDPISKAKFGGSMEELSQVTSYLRSMAELEKNTEKLRSASSWGGPSGSADQPEGGGKKDTKKKGKGKGKKSDEPKENETT